MNKHLIALIVLSCYAASAAENLDEDNKNIQMKTFAPPMSSIGLIDNEDESKEIGNIYPKSQVDEKIYKEYDNIKIINILLPLYKRNFHIFPYLRKNIKYKYFSYFENTYLQDGNVRTYVYDNIDFFENSVKEAYRKQLQKPKDTDCSIF